MLMHVPLPGEKAMSLHLQAGSDKYWILRELPQVFMSFSSSFRHKQWLVLKVRHLLPVLNSIRVVSFNYSEENQGTFEVH